MVISSRSERLPARFIRTERSPFLTLRGVVGVELWIGSRQFAAQRSLLGAQRLQSSALVLLLFTDGPYALRRELVRSQRGQYCTDTG